MAVVRNTGGMWEGPGIGRASDLIAIDRPQPNLFALPERAWRGPNVLVVGVAAARKAGLEVGILRAERALHRPADVRAARADPMIPAELATILVARVA